MFKTTPEEMARIKGSLDKSISEQHVIFETLNYNPYDDGQNHDEVLNNYVVVVMQKSQYESQREEYISWPEDYGICDEARAEQIKAGAPLTQHEDNAINESIFEHDDTYMVVGVITDGVDEIYTLKVHQIQGRLGVHVIDFLGFYDTREAAEDAVTNTDYFVYGSF